MPQSESARRAVEGSRNTAAAGTVPRSGVSEEKGSENQSSDKTGSTFDDIGRAGQSASRYLSDTLKTLELEGRKSALVIAFICAFATVAAVLVTTAWMGAQGFLGFVLVREGVSIWLVAIGILIINLGIAWLAWLFMLKLADRISFSASQRRLLMNEKVTKP